MIELKGLLEDGEVIVRYHLCNEYCHGMQLQ